MNYVTYKIAIDFKNGETSIVDAGPDLTSIRFMSGLLTVSGSAIEMSWGDDFHQGEVTAFEITLEKI